MHAHGNVGKKHVTVIGEAFRKRCVAVIPFDARPRKRVLAELPKKPTESVVVWWVTLFWLVIEMVNCPVPPRLGQQ